MDWNLAKHLAKSAVLTSWRADGNVAADAEEDAKPKAMDRARSAYLIEGPDGDFACGVRISSFTMHRLRTASLELPATVPGACSDSTRLCAAATSRTRRHAAWT